MNINRNNYENFFLLYADGELCAADKQATDDFLIANPDLKKEFVLLQQTVADPEEIIFPLKNDLLKTGQLDEALMEKLLLKLDNESNQTETSFKELLANNTHAGKEFEFLKRLKLDAEDTFIFQNKALLFKREKDNVVISGFVRWAAAAAIIGFGIFLGLKLLSKRQEGTVAVNSNNNKENFIKSEIVPQVKSEVIVKSSLNIPQKNAAEKVIGKAEALDNIATAVKENKKQNVPVTNKNIVTFNNQNEEKVVLAKKEAIVFPQQNIAPDVQPQLQQIAIAPPVNKKIAAQEDKNLIPLENSFAQKTVLAENENTDNKILYMDEDEIKRTKAVGFFKKIKRVIERTAKIKTGNTLRIAGFAFAAK
jgi:hypothetical protein